MNRMDKIEKTSVLQHDSSDCGVACLGSVIRYFGGDFTSEGLRNLSGTGRYGTSMLGLYQAAGKSGLEATGYEASLSDIKDHPNPLILHVLIEEKLEHYIICFGYEKGRFIIWDPAKGRMMMNDEELEKIWKSRKCLSLSCNGAFRTRKNQGLSRRKWMLKMLRPDKDLLIVSAIMGVLISVLGLVMAIYSQKLIDKILPSGEMRILLVSSGLVLLLLITRIIISCIRQMFILMQGKIFNIRVIDDFFNSLLFLRKSFFDTRRTGDFVARLNDTMRIQRVIADIISIYIIDILVLLITTIILFYYSVVIGLVSLICLPLFYLLVSSRNKRIISSQYDLMAGYASNESNFIDSIKGIAEIKSFNWQSLFSRRNKIVYSDFQEKAYNLGKIKVQLTLITGIAGSVYLVAILVCSSIFVMKKELTQGELMAIISLASSILPSAVNLALIAIPLSEVKVAVNRMFEFTQIESEPVNNPENTGYKADKLILKDISFRFPGQRLLLDKINLEIEKGKIASLIGESGSGKSTIAGIILRFYDPEEGRLLFGDECASIHPDINTWRSKIAVIPQEIHIFNGTILQNLIDEPDETRVNELLVALSEIGLIPFINSFPSGLLTIVGEAGINLSGGQKQVLAFIRAVLTKPDILIIDEGTSNMDRKTEALILNIILKLKSRMGILFISHRLNMIKKLSDVIYILEDRTIKCSGNHEDLLSGNNFYSALWKDFD